MKIGLLKEIKIGEGRVALTPDAVETLINQGNTVMVQHDAGKASGFSNLDYVSAGAEVMKRKHGIWWTADLIVKVKEPLPVEYKFFRKELKLLSYLHLAANPDLVQAIKISGMDAIALEDVEREGRHTALDPMSIVAGKVAVNLGISGLLFPNGGNGILPGGVLGTKTGMGVVIGGGVSGMAAAREMLLHSMDVVVFDINPDVIANINQRSAKMNRMGGNIVAKMSRPSCIASALEHADITIGAVLVPGTRAPIVITEEMMDTMKKGSVLIDIAIDQGGCVENIKTTDWDNPSYKHKGFTIFAIPNLPGAVPNTSSIALSNVIQPLITVL